MNASPAARSTFSKLRALGKKAVAGKNGLRAGRARGFKDQVDAQIAIGRLLAAKRDRNVGFTNVSGVAIRSGVDSDTANAQALQRANGTNGDLAAIGDQDGMKHGTTHFKLAR